MVLYRWRLHLASRGQGDEPLILRPHQMISNESVPDPLLNLQFVSIWYFHLSLDLCILPFSPVFLIRLESTESEEDQHSCTNQSNLAIHT